MSLLDWIKGTATSRGGQGDTETVRRIAGELDKLEPARARHLAALAYILSRVAGADHRFADEETDKMVELIRREDGIPEDQALLVVEIAKNQNRLFGSTENYLVTREFRQIASDAERRQLLDWLFAVSAADDSITSEEDAQIRQIASELGVPHDEVIELRLKWSEKRTVLRKIP
jgi:uncharacterized tellurite resistance protein B-like protein